MNHRTMRRLPGPGAAVLGCLLWTVASASLLASESPAASGDESSCVACHSDADFLVTNKKLYDYFQEWTSSIHKQEGVSCEDCHGGNAEARDKDSAHEGPVSESRESSAVYFKRISETCGQCHEDILDGFQKSAHFEHVVAREQEDQGPTCVTCHGSINVDVLNVATVEESCARCHNDETDNHPENPERAREILNKFLSIHRFYRYIVIRAKAPEAKRFFEEMDPRLRHLTVTWHTFDLEKIEEETKAVLDLMKAKRDEVRRKRVAKQ